ncbi:tumor necrosis factor receptor superfamily member 9 [Alligator mississippiensis]|uniref:Tumor necrosis factor receptor superfamily member 9 n=1 Tax=Alligator mississippiensis TaxID=8496 RepID=A0A151LYK7_ALLMI|nr:tumor necrosis factor receptor superfamily member 9 [Alligator mississippiensis]KYO17347.1 tumor necrosis factor receptor superfamily member 9 [Alligator mississippiensis]
MGRGRLRLVTAALLLLSVRAAPPCDQTCPAGTYLDPRTCGRTNEPCKLCPTGTFASEAGARGGCISCRICEGIFTYRRSCSAIEDAQCKCKSGYRCTRGDCRECAQNCGRGEQLIGTGCETCPWGTFNNQSDGFCKKWTKCSGDEVLKQGTSTSDVICSHMSGSLAPPASTTYPAIPFSTPGPGKNLEMDIVLTVGLVLAIVFLLPLGVFLIFWKKRKLPDMLKRIYITPEQSTQEEDACSCRFPEEEQGEYDDCSKLAQFKDSPMN